MDKMRVTFDDDENLPNPVINREISLAQKRARVESLKKARAARWAGHKKKGVFLNGDSEYFEVTKKQEVSGMFDSEVVVKLRNGLLDIHRQQLEDFDERMGYNGKLKVVEKVSPVISERIEKLISSKVSRKPHRRIRRDSRLYVPLGGILKTVLQAADSFNRPFTTDEMSLKLKSIFPVIYERTKHRSNISTQLSGARQHGYFTVSKNENGDTLWHRTIKTQPVA
jgi:hypothetical protein